MIARLDTYDKVQRHLVGLMLDPAFENVSADELEIESPDEGKKIGRVTSLAYSPELGRAIGLAYVRSQYAIPGSQVGIVASGDSPRPITNATITKLPFDL